MSVRTIANRLFQAILLIALVFVCPMTTMARKRHGAAKKDVSPRQKEIPVNSGRSVRQQVDSFVEMMVKELAIAKNNKEKFHALHVVEERIDTLRDNSLTQSAQDESYMDLMMSVLESLPGEKDFKRRDCEKYQADLLNQFDPTAEEAPQEPAVKPGWMALQSLCQ